MARRDSSLRYGSSFPAAVAHEYALLLLVSVLAHSRHFDQYSSLSGRHAHSSNATGNPLCRLTRSCGFEDRSLVEGDMAIMIRYVPGSYASFCTS